MVEFVAVGEEFYQLWVPGQNARMLYILTILTMLSYLLEGVVGPLYYVYTITVKNKIPCTGAYKVCKSNGPLFAVMAD